MSNLVSKNVKFINKVILEECKKNIDEILSSEWYGWEDCSFEYLREEDYRSNMLVRWNGDRGGMGIYFEFMNEVEDEEDMERYMWEKEDEWNLVVIEDDKLIDRRE